MDKEVFIQARKADIEMVKDAAKEASEEFEKNAGYVVETEIDTDSQMYSDLGNRYQRWQVRFEEPIGFGGYNSIPYLLELGYQYIEELDALDANPINKLVESFELNSQ